MTQAPKSLKGLARGVKIWDTSGDDRFSKQTNQLVKVADAVLVLYNRGEREAFADATNRLLRATAESPQMPSSCSSRRRWKKVWTTTSGSRTALSAGADFRTLRVADVRRSHRHCSGTSCSPRAGSGASRGRSWRTRAAVSSRAQACMLRSWIDGAFLGRLAGRLIQFSLAFVHWAPNGDAQSDTSGGSTRARPSPAGPARASSDPTPSRAARRRACRGAWAASFLHL